MPQFSEAAKAFIWASLGAIFLGDAGGDVILETVSMAIELAGELFETGGEGLGRAGDMLQ